MTMKWCSGTTAVLDLYGYHVLAAETAEEALGILRTGGAIDALVTDFAMPGMSGIELVKEARLRFPTLPVLVMTGHAENPRETFGSAFIQKPFQAEALIKELGRILSIGERAAG